MGVLKKVYTDGCLPCAQSTWVQFSAALIAPFLPPEIIPECKTRLKLCASLSVDQKAKQKQNKSVHSVIENKNIFLKFKLNTKIGSLIIKQNNQMCKYITQ